MFQHRTCRVPPAFAMFFQPEQLFNGVLCHDKEAMPQAPDDKGPVCTMPQPRAEKHDQLVPVSLCLALPVAAQWDIQTFPEPSGKGDMPSAPEFLNTGRDVRIVKVFLEVEPKAQAQADGHIAVSAEVEIDLHQIAHRGQPSRPAVQHRAVGVVDQCYNIAADIGDQQLLAQAHNKPAQAFCQLLQRISAAMYLICHVLIADDRSCHQLWKQSNVQQYIPEMSALQAFIPVYIDHITQPLKGEERDTHRQNDGRHRDRHARQPVYCLYQKSQILENTQDSQINGHSGIEHALSPGDEQTGQIIAEHREQQQQNIPQPAEGIEQQTGCDEPEIFCFPSGQKIIASQHDGQKQKQENYGTKNHFSATSAITETGS